MTVLASARSQISPGSFLYFSQIGRLARSTTAISVNASVSIIYCPFAFRRNLRLQLQISNILPSFIKGRKTFLRSQYAPFSLSECTNSRCAVVFLYAPKCVCWIAAELGPVIWTVTGTGWHAWKAKGRRESSRILSTAFHEEDHCDMIHRPLPMTYAFELSNRALIFSCKSDVQIAAS